MVRGEVARVEMITRKEATMNTKLSVELVLAVDNNQQPEIFYSLQGEGPAIGRPSVFIRLSGCNLQCVWCDTAYTWNWEGTSFPHDQNQKFNRNEEQVRLRVGEIVKRLEEQPCRNLVLTGGEPLIQRRQIPYLLDALSAKEKSWVVDIETNGTLMPGEDLDRHVSFYVVSPKLSNARMATNRRIRKVALRWFAASRKAYFKFVVSQRADLREVAAIIEDYGICNDRVFLMPEADNLSRLKAVEKHVAKWCLNDGWRYSDRLHLRLYGHGRGI